jgi:hypothetical protein
MSNHLPHQHIIKVANFYSSTTYCNNSQISEGNAIEFPQNGPNNSTITRVSNSIFKIKDTSLYEIIFQINIRQAGQLIIVMNGFQLAHTLIDQDYSGQNIGIFIISANSGDELSINNPLGAPTISIKSGQIIIKQL